MRLIFALVATTLLAACNPMENMNYGKARIAEFHELYSAGKGDELYRSVSPEFRKATTRKQFDDLLEVVTARLGKVKTTGQSSFNVNTTPAGTQTVIQMATTFEQGEGVEVFTFKGNGQDMSLIGWNVNSPRLMVTPADIHRQETAGLAKGG